MDLNDIQDALDDLRPEEDSPEDSLTILMVKLGQMAQGGLQLDGADVDDETASQHRRDLLAGVIVAAVEYASEHDIDVETAVEERMEYMREMAEQQAEVQAAIEDGDAAALADALGSDSNEVPTPSDDDNPRGVY